ncbi:4-coumarate--CoA ligase-like 7 [Termitomyces sp. T112]|nr:4-coumarate--CoA ligase-like 7 [Termitomyces sp. T112]
MTDALSNVIDIYGLVLNLHFLLFAGMSIVVVPKFSLGSFLNSIIRYRITHLFIVPPQAVLLCKHPSVRGLDFRHVKYCMSGAAPLSGELLQMLCEVFPNAAIGQGYGLTETCATITMLPTTQKIGTVGSSGQLIPGMRAKVVKEDGSLAREGEQGELVVTGPSMALQYMNNKAATKETFVDGWVRTGDEVVIRNGDLFVVDRLKEIIKVRGFQVAPAELEGHLLTHSDVADACVVSVLDDYNGELPFAYVVLSDIAARRIAGNAKAAVETKATIAKYVADAKVHYKHLKGGVEFIDAIPKNPSGKILRRVLRDKARKFMGNNSTETHAKL